VIELAANPRYSGGR